MFRLEDGRMRFYQWDTGVRIVVSDPSIAEVHFCNTTEECSLVCEAYTENGLRYANVPNVLLQEAFPIRVYGFDGTYTKHYTVFNIVARTKPADYVYTETEIKSWEALEKRMDEIEGAVTTEGVQKAIEKYLDENPINADLTGYATENYVDKAIETIELTPGPQGEPGKDGYTPIKGVDYFDGKDGKNGTNGKDGYTPVKGKDYFDGAPGKDGKDYVLTDADKQAIAQLAIEIMPAAEGGAY